MLLSFLLFGPNVFIICAALSLVCLFAGLPLLLRPTDGAGSAAEGEVVDFADQLVGGTGATTLVTQLLVRFRTASGYTVVGPASTGSSRARLHFRRGQRVPVRYDPADPRQFAVPTADVARRTFTVVVYCLTAAGLLGLSVLLFILSAVLRAA